MTSAMISSAARGGLLDHGDVELALLGVGDLLGLIDGSEASRAQEAFDGLRGRIRAGTLLFLARVGGTGGEAANVERQAARRPVFARAS